MLISVVVPVYNVETYLGCCVESILGQTYRDLQIILVDDGSTDNSGRLCDGYAKEDTRIQVIHKKNGGLVSARKAGLSAAKGEYISYVDSDDWLEQEAYQTLVELGTEADIIAFAGYEEYGKGIERGLKKNTVREGLYETEEELRELHGCMMVNDNFFENGVLTYLWSKLICRKLLCEIQGIVPDSVSYGEDAACVYPCLLKAKSVFVTNMLLYHYRIRQDSMVGSEVGQDKLSSLFAVLGKRFYDYPIREILRWQLKYSMCQAVLLKGYMDIKHSMTLFPFEKVGPGMRVAVYGAGLFGQVIRQACQKRGLPAAGWFDKRYEVYADGGCAVFSPDSIHEGDFDVMVIAILNIRLAGQITEELIHGGIPAEKIDYINMNLLEEMELPKYMEDILDTLMHYS